MSLYEINSMIAALEKTDPNRPMSDEEFEASMDRWRRMNLPDVKLPDPKD